jgi:XTP/dITP diphosphohydrolase
MLKSLTDLNYDSEIEETGLTLEENALIKARTIFNTFKKDCFADDSGLEVSALGGKPGVFSARYAGNHRNAEDNTQNLFEGIIKGEISNSPLGQNGFGYDPIFIPEKQPLTFAQLTLYEKNKISHRSRAFEKLVEFLKR